jgi:hypothetical protein
MFLWQFRLRFFIQLANNYQELPCSKRVFQFLAIFVSCKILKSFIEGYRSRGRSRSRSHQREPILYQGMTPTCGRCWPLPLEPVAGLLVGHSEDNGCAGQPGKWNTVYSAGISWAGLPRSGNTVNLSQLLYIAVGCLQCGHQLGWSAYIRKHCKLVPTIVYCLRLFTMRASAGLICLDQETL